MKFARPLLKLAVTLNLVGMTVMWSVDAAPVNELLAKRDDPQKPPDPCGACSAVGVHSACCLCYHNCLDERAAMNAFLEMREVEEPLVKVRDASVADLRGSDTAKIGLQRRSDAKDSVSHFQLI
ncbi:hypothetical protein BDZ90DRAFT_260003 [Jaminaea rosea]|uniref:Secreted protein n=1 Tax=Jaminaea rosea TaxID=1569628 RepID=A0A316UW86_9BASI|nr:hypothetical protein BDZ90DRAFT_260003 [Jaminaea rosea]PWN28183.1 hypothetical protein BDZ90DRAFT_260003 [Jaminaea rosea]